MNRRTFVTSTTTALTVALVSSLSTFNGGNKAAKAQAGANAVCQTVDFTVCEPVMLRTFGKDADGDNFSIVYVEAIILADNVGISQEEFLHGSFIDDWAVRNAGLVWEFGWLEATQHYGQYGLEQIMPELRDGDFRALMGSSAQSIPTQFDDGSKVLTTFFIHDNQFAYIITTCFCHEETYKLITALSKGKASIYALTADLETYKVVDPNDYPQLWKSS